MLDFLSAHWEWATGIVVTIIVGLWAWRRLRVKVKASKRVDIGATDDTGASIGVKDSEDVKVRIGKTD